jgi:flagellar biosynthesis protein FliR
MGAMPLLAAAAAGRLVDLAATGRAQGTYSTLFGVLAAAVFVGIDGHVAFLRAIVESHVTTTALTATQTNVVLVLAKLIPAAVRLAIPWLVTAAVVQLAVGVGTRVAGRTSAFLPAAAAVPSAIVMMTASLVATFAVAFAALVRGAL